jgi:hypothetical protein
VTGISQLPESPPPSVVTPPEELDEVPPLLLLLLLLTEPEELPPASGGGELELLEHATARAPVRDTAIRPNHLLGDMRFLLLSASTLRMHARGPQRAHPIGSRTREKHFVWGS